ncbi:sulfatase-like hydrolase/transferase [Planctomycetota bacterium]
MRYLLTTLCLIAFLIQNLSAAERPNLVMIFTDDQRHDAVGYTGNDAIHTPNLDRLAQQGLIFRNCFVNTSICAVSRANLLSGQYPGRHSIDDFHKTFTPKQLKQTVPARLRDAGYQTAFFGKWGIGDSPKRTYQGAAVFDYWAGQPMQTCFFHEPDCRYVKFNGFDRPLEDLCDCPADASGRLGYRNRVGKANLQSPLHVDAEITPIHVERFLDGRDAEKPFCMMLFFKAPHGPFTDWDPATAHLTDGKAMPRPAAATLANAKREPEIIKKSLGRPSGMRYLQDPRWFDRHMRDYYRLIASMDAGVGRIMQSLSERGLDQKTVVLFTSDNGHYKGEHGLAGKWLMHEPSLRVPGFLFDPRQPCGKTTDRMVITTDFSVTLLALAGIDMPGDMTGHSLTALYANATAPWRKDFYYDHPYGHGGRIPRTVGVRTETHTYTRYTDPNPPFEQLFDLKSDPDQLNNLADQPHRSALLKRLRDRCDELSSECN